MSLTLVETSTKLLFQPKALVLIVPLLTSSYKVSPDLIESRSLNPEAFTPLETKLNFSASGV